MRLLLALALVSACGLAAAQAPMYRSTMPDGKKVISERPMPDAVKVEEIKVSPGNYAPGSPPPKSASPAPKSGSPAAKPGSPGAKPAPPGAKAADPDAARKARAAELAAAEQELASAQAEYNAAVANAAKGREEVPGDRQGTAKGGARFSEDYEKRQTELQAAVAAAEARLSNARRRYNDAR